MGKKLRVVFSGISQEELFLRLLNRRVSHKCELCLTAAVEADANVHCHTLFCQFLPTRINVIPRKKDIFSPEIKPFAFVVGEIQYNFPGEESKVIRVVMKFDLQAGRGHCLRPSIFQPMFEELERREQALLSSARELTTIFPD